MSDTHTQGRAVITDTHSDFEFVVLRIGINDINCKTEANARRLAACWNACEGLPTQDLEALSVPFSELSLGGLLSVRKELDAARALLSEILRLDEATSNNGEFGSLVGNMSDRIRAFLEAK